MKKTIFFLAIVFLFAGVAVASDEFGKVDIHGFISQGYLKSSDHDFYSAKTSDGTFEFNEMGLNFSTQLTDDLRMGLQFLAKDLGEFGNDEIYIDYALADWRFQDWLGLRAGKMKRPNGLYNKSRDIDATRTFVLLPSGIYNERQRESQMATTGVGIYGTLPGNLDYNIQYGIYPAAKDGGTARGTEDVIQSTILYNPPYLTVDAETTGYTNDARPIGEIYWRTPLEGLKIGGTYGTFTMNQDLLIAGSHAMQIDGKGELYQGSVEYTYNNFLISSEYRIIKMESKTSESPETKRDLEAYYIMTSYRFSEWFELGAYYSIDYADKDDRDGKKGILPDENGSILYLYEEQAYLKDLALCTRFDINSNWIVKLEAHKMDGLNWLNPLTIEDEPDWMLYAAKISYSF